MSVITWPNVSELDRRVLIRRWTSQANFDMGLNETFDVGITRWAKIKPVAGSAFFDGQQTDEGMTHRIWIKYGTGSKPQDITTNHVIDHAASNERFRVLRATNVGDAQRYTMIEVNLLGAIQ